MDTSFSMVSFLVSSSHETFVEENRWFRVRGGYRSKNQSSARVDLSGAESSHVPTAGVFALLGPSVFF